MKKSSFIAMILENVSFMLFALGMCFSMVWGTMIQGIIIGFIGIIIFMLLIPITKVIKE